MPILPTMRPVGKCPFYHNDKCELQKGHLPSGRIVGNIGVSEPEHTIDDGAVRDRCKPK